MHKIFNIKQLKSYQYGSLSLTSFPAPKVHYLWLPYTSGRIPAKTRIILIISKSQREKMADYKMGAGNLQDELEQFLVQESKEVFNK